MPTNIRKRKLSRSRSRSQSPPIAENDSGEKIPEEFFCPISNNFMSEPVRIPATGLTYDRNSVKHLYEPQDLQPDLRIILKMEEWLSRYKLDPPYDFISKEEDLVSAINSSFGRNSDALELKAAILEKPWLLCNGGAIRCVAQFLRCPQPSVYWVVNAVSIVAHPQNEDHLLVPPDIHPEYSLLGPIEIACGSQHGDFIAGLINLMHALLMGCPDISVMADKLGRITEALVSYLWPMRYENMRSYRKLLMALERLAEKEEFCEKMVDAEVLEGLLSLLDFWVSSNDNGSYNPDSIWMVGLLMEDPQRTTLKTSLRILDRVTQSSERACARMARLVIVDKTRVLATAVRKIRYVDRECRESQAASLCILARSNPV